VNGVHRDDAANAVFAFVFLDVVRCYNRPRKAAGCAMSGGHHRHHLGSGVSASAGAGASAGVGVGVGISKHKPWYVYVQESLSSDEVRQNRAMSKRLKDVTAWGEEVRRIAQKSEKELADAHRTEIKFLQNTNAVRAVCLS
jgi:hypothetical protein